MPETGFCRLLYFLRKDEISSIIGVFCLLRLNQINWIRIGLRGSLTSDPKELRRLGYSLAKTFDHVIQLGIMRF